MKNDTVEDMLQNTLQKITDEKLELAESDEERKDILETMKKMDFAPMIDMIANDTTKYMWETMYEEVMEFRAIEQGFLARQEQKWYRAFVSSEAMYIMVHEAGETYDEYVSSLEQDAFEKKYYQYIAFQHLQGRALQQFLQIITLMRNGFADGAYARWRSMYELTIIASFIEKYGESVAKAYIEASNSETERYDWAKSSGIFDKLPSKKHITFANIQKNCDINVEIWENHYDLANKAIHASPQGTFARLGSEKSEENIIISGRTDYGITISAEHSAISLAQITSIFFALFPSADSIVAIKYINNWIDVIRENYFKAHDAVFPEDDKEWDDKMISFEEKFRNNNDDIDESEL